MEQLERFEQEYRRCFNDNLYMIKIPRYLFLFFTGMLTAATFHKDMLEDGIMIPIIGLVFAGYVAYFYVVEMININENGRKTSIFEKTKYLPFDQNAFIKRRMKELLCFEGKVLFVYYIIQSFFSLLILHHLTWIGIGYILVEGVWMLLFGTLVMVSGSDLLKRSR